MYEIDWSNIMYQTLGDLKNTQALGHICDPTQTDLLLSDSKNIATKCYDDNNNYDTNKRLCLNLNFTFFHCLLPKFWLQIYM